MRLVRLSLCLLPLALACNPSGVEEASGEAENPNVSEEVQAADMGVVEALIADMNEYGCEQSGKTLEERQAGLPEELGQRFTVELDNDLNPDEIAELVAQANEALMCGEEVSSPELEENTDEGGDGGGDEVDGEENAEATGNEDAETTGDPSDGE